MSDTHIEEAARPARVEVLGGVLGLLVFAAGIAMIVLVFSWTYRVFSNLDEELTGGSVVVTAPSPPARGPGAAGGGSSGAVTARPRGPGLGHNALKLALKLLCLLILALCGSLVAAKGAQLAGAYRGKRT